MSDVLVYVFCLIDSAVLLFFAVFYIITLSDLECDYINAHSCCKRMNTCVIPEIVAQCAMAFATVCSLYWLPIAITFPMTGYVIYRYLSTPKSHMKMYDPAEILNRKELQTFLRQSMVKLGYHMLCFFFFLYSMIMALVSKEKGES